MITLSIIIPVYNAEAYLAKCIESIITQNGNEWELILVDDGSTDNSLSIARNYARDNRIRILTQGNCGPSSARNRGIAAAKGKYIAFIDADDWVNPNYISTILKHADDADILFWGLRKVHENGDISSYWPKEDYAKSPDEIEAILQSLIVNTEKVPYFGFTFTKLFKKEIIDRHGLAFNQDLRIKEDELFVWQYCRHIKSIKTISWSPYNYRILSQSLSHNRRTFANYSLLAQETILATNWIQTDGLKRIRHNIIFDYITGAVLEAICSKDKDMAKGTIKSRLLPYMKQNRKAMNLPLWGKVSICFPTTILTITFIYTHLNHYSKRWKK